MADKITLIYKKEQQVNKSKLQYELHKKELEDIKNGLVDCSPRFKFSIVTTLSETEVYNLLSKGADTNFTLKQMRLTPNNS